MLDNINIDNYSEENNVDKYTIEDIIECFKRHNRDFRDDFEKPILKSNILTIDDLKIGMHVSSKQLSDLFNYYIILSNSSISDDGTSIIGDIIWFGDKMTTETEKYNKNDRKNRSVHAQLQDHYK